MNDHGIAFTGIVLAGGRSTRMGRDKALLALADGKTLLARAVETLRATGASEILVSVAHGKTYGLAGTREVADLQEDCGPMGGLAASLAVAGHPLCLVLAVDMPGMMPAYLRGLLREARPGCGVVPVIDGSFEPLAAVYPRETSASMADALASRDLSLQRLIRNLEQRSLVRLLEMGVEEKALFANWNSPEDCLDGA